MSEPRADRSSFAQGTSRGLGAWALSIVAHALVIVLAFFIVWTVTPAEQDVTPAVANFDDPGLAPAPETVTDEAADDVSEPLELIPDPVEPEPPVSLSDLLRDLDDAQETFVVERETLPERTLQAESRTFPEVRFAGTGASNAEKIVYVVDASGSLRSTWPRLVEELTRSINRLAPTQRFQVVFFLDAPRSPLGYAIAPSPEGARAHSLLRATRENVRDATGWFESLSPAGRGDPLGAIEIAFGFEPDAVFLLARFTGIVSDPDKAELLSALDALNPRVGPSQNRRVAINGIQFLDEDPKGVLRAVAREHGGTDPANAYKLLTRDEISARRRTPE